MARKSKVERLQEKVDSLTLQYEKADIACTKAQDAFKKAKAKKTKIGKQLDDIKAELDQLELQEMVEAIKESNLSKEDVLALIKSKEGK